jgi:hypothetical protein
MRRIRPRLPEWPKGTTYIPLLSSFLLAGCALISARPNRLGYYEAFHHTEKKSAFTSADQLTPFEVSDGRRLRHHSCSFSTVTHCSTMTSWQIACLNSRSRKSPSSGDTVVSSIPKPQFTTASSISTGYILQDHRSFVAEMHLSAIPCCRRLAATTNV